MKNHFGLKDTPISSKADESLGLADYADALTDFISQCDTPMTVALQGDWGSGKTSLMNLIRADIQQQNSNTHLIWFNTWQYSQFSMAETLALSLIRSFIDEVKGDVEAPKLEKAMNALGKAARFGSSMAATYLTGDAGAVDNAMAAAGGGSFDDPSKAIKELKYELERLVNQHPAERIVVFIDDLDRLVPKKAVELLENLKLFLDIPKCVYVLACDYQVVVQGLKSKFGVTEGELKGKSFFDKIIQVPFNMPISHYQVKGYFEGLLKKINVECDSDIDDYIALVSASAGFNPRNLKRLFNSLLLLKIVAKKGALKNNIDFEVDDNEITRVLFAILCMQSHYEELHQFLMRNSVDINILKKLSTKTAIENDEKLEDLKEALGAKLNDKSYMARFSQFVEAFINAIQLAADEDDEDRKNLSQDEVNVLNSVLNFSSLVSTDDHVNFESLSDERAKNRKLAQRLIEKLNQDYAESFKATDYTLSNSGFRLFQNRDRKDASVYIYLEVNELPFSLYFGLWDDPITKEFVCGSVFESVKKGDIPKLHKWMKASNINTSFEFDEECWSYMSDSGSYMEDLTWEKFRDVFSRFVMSEAKRLTPVYLKK